ncbi:unnamed protein product [Sphagnum troendelagicum]|uniref:Vesicle transport v-SNARE N-terminal domain-containing protein n=1 Tax=Sphagnum troendelagicum TaxID=128251 RepID=A0ABP0TLV4_9BRYO
MSEIFEGYEHQYCKLSANLPRECTSYSFCSNSWVFVDLKQEEKKCKLSELKTGLDEAESLDFKKVSMAHDPVASRNELMESRVADHVMRTRLLMSTERLNQSGEKIKESKWTLLGTEELGVSILQDLHSQQQTLLHAHNMSEKLICRSFFRDLWSWLQGVDDNIGKSWQILNTMGRQMTWNKWI